LSLEQIRLDFEKSLGFEVDRFQSEAFDLLDTKSNVVVAAPTGAGKTLVADYAVEQTVKTDGRIFYTTPIKALSNQKYRDLLGKYGENNVGLLTGDISINSSAKAIVMTTEVLRNMIYSGNDLSQLKSVVLDEVHYLQDKFRGAVWEEVIIHLPKHVQLVCLSATVSNADQLTNWISAVRGRTELVVETQRPISLENYYMAGERNSERVHMVKVVRGAKVNPDGFKFDQIQRGRGRHGGKGRQKRKWSTPRYLDVILHLKNKDMLPAIYFKFSRAGCDDAVRSIASTGFSLTNSEDKKKIKSIVSTHLDNLDDKEKEILEFDKFRDSLLAGVASHHAGLIPAFKEVVEVCFVSGLLKVVFATETLALGINMPARTVVIDKLTKFTGETHEFLTPSQYTQLIGRAGRRGIDTKGSAVVLWSPFVDFREVADLITSKDFVLSSSFRPNYNMAANLVKNYDRAKARELLGLSFAQFRADAQIVLNERGLEKLSRRKGKLNKRMHADGAKKNNRDQRRIEKLEIEIQKTRKGNSRIQKSLVSEFDRVIELMEDRGHLRNWMLTSSGEQLAKIYHESDLLISEVMDAAIFDGLNPAEIAGLVSVFCYEERRKDRIDTEPWFPSKDLATRFRSIKKIHKSLVRQEARSRIDLTREPDAGFMATAHGWAAGGDLDEVLEDENIPAGDFVRTIKQLTDLLRQIGNLSENRETASQARKAVDLIQRSLVNGSSSSEAN